MEVIQKGLVRVNQQVIIEPSFPVDPKKDKVSYDNQPVEMSAYQYILLNKPAGYTTTKQDRYALKTVYDLLPDECRKLAPAGRLDKDTEGLLILSNDGDFIYYLTHPKFNVEKRYFACIDGELDKETQRKIETGIILEGIKTYPATIKVIRTGKKQTDLEIIIHEGRKRQIRMMFAKFHFKVIYLKRLTQGPFLLGNLKQGSWRELSLEEIRRVKSLKIK